MQNTNRDSVICLFDLDGTLTYPRQVLNCKFKIQNFTSIKIEENKT